MILRSKTFFLAHRVLGSNLERHYREFVDAQRWTVDQLDALSTRRLQHTLEHAARNIPYYSRLVDGSTSRALMLEQFPILTKQKLSEHYEELMSPKLFGEYKGTLRKKQYSWIEVKTGGSTGAPTRVVHDKEFREFGRASRLFCNSLCGFPVGTPYFMLWGSMKDINQMQASSATRVLNAFLNFEVMNAFRMDDERMATYLRRINASSKKHMMAYADAAYQLALFAKRENVTVRKLDSIMGCAGTITADMREVIENVFQCKLQNKYGSRDCGDMACECEEGGFHIFSNFVHLEIVDEAGRAVPAGQSGRILVTLLTNANFPLIRYEIGDVGSFSERQCACGSPMPLLKEVEGRTYEIIHDTKGNVVTPIYFRHLIGVVHNPGNIRRFQFVQMGQRSYELFLETDPHERDSLKMTTSKIQDDLQRVLGTDAAIAITSVDRIEESASGKFLYTRNDYSKNKTQ